MVQICISQTSIEMQIKKMLEMVADEEDFHFRLRANLMD